MKFLYGIALALSMCGAVEAQTAKVIQLSPEDAKAAKALDDEQKALTKRIADFNESVRVKYLMTDTGKKEYARYSKSTTLNFIITGSGSWYKAGWEVGFEFTEDFLFIVPVRPTVTGFNNGTNCCTIFATAN